MHSILAVTAARALDLACQNYSPVFVPAVRGPFPVARPEADTLHYGMSDPPATLAGRGDPHPAQGQRVQSVDVKSSGVHQYVLARSCRTQLPVDATRPIFNFAVTNRPVVETGISWMTTTIHDHSDTKCDSASR